MSEPRVSNHYANTFLVHREAWFRGGYPFELCFHPAIAQRYIDQNNYHEYYISEVIDSITGRFKYIYVSSGNADNNDIGKRAREHENDDEYRRTIVCIQVIPLDGFNAMVCTRFIETWVTAYYKTEMKGYYEIVVGGDWCHQNDTNLNYYNYSRFYSLGRFYIHIHLHLGYIWEMVYTSMSSCSYATSPHSKHPDTSASAAVDPIVPSMALTGPIAEKESERNT